MKTPVTTPRGAALPRLLALLLLLLLALLVRPVRAQFPVTAATTQFVCNAPGVQAKVQAVADGAGGSFVAWVDKRGGNTSGPGTALYMQHLNAAGVPLLAANGLRLFQTRDKEIWGMKMVPWQSGLLVAWVQGGFGIGGDTIRCQFYSAAGAPQWSIPTVVAYRTLPTVIYVLEYGLNVIPTSTGATITYDLTLNGGGDRLGFNQIGSTGALRFPNNQWQLPLPSANSLLTLADGGDGFYVVSGYGGFSSPIYAQHYDLNGNGWANQLEVAATGTTGRGGQNWRAVRDPAGNLYVVWGSDGADILAAKVTPAGALGWAAPGYRNLCTFASRQESPDAIWHDNALWAVWDDGRPSPNGFSTQYMQRVDAAGNLAWSATGVLVNSLDAGYPAPKLAASNNGAVMAFFLTAYGQGFRAQKVLPTGSLGFAANGVLLHNVQQDQPSYLDYVPVGQPNGSVQVFWSSSGAGPNNQDICAGRMQNSGTLLSATERAAEAAGFDVYPNPATTELRVSLSVGASAKQLRLYDALGRSVRAYAEAGPAAALSLRGLPLGLYVLRGTLAGQQVSRRVAVE